MRTDTTDLIVNPESYWRRRAEKAEARVEELTKLTEHGNGAILLGWLEAHGKAMDNLEKAEERVKELERKLKLYETATSYPRYE